MKPKTDAERIKNLQNTVAAMKLRIDELGREVSRLRGAVAVYDAETRRCTTSDYRTTPNGATR